jgi:hypothetical protein
VSIVYDTGSTRALVTSVAPDEGAPTPGAPGGYSLTARDAAGHALASAGALAYSVHIDGAPPQLIVVGRVPAAGARTIEVTGVGRVLAVDRASAAAPTARLISPRAGARVGGPRGAVIRWVSRDADGDALKATIRYSPDDGRTWRTVFAGADRGSAILPGSILGATRRARIRLYVSDGFDAAIATSARFVSVGAPPQVAITSPGRGLRASAGSALSLTGSAFEDAGVRLSGRSLTWRSGRQVLGSGERAVTLALPAGRHLVTLTARDRQGRSTTASVAVTIVPAVPVLRLLRVPRRISKKATSLGLQIASLAPATLQVAGRRLLVGRAQSSVRVPVRADRKPLQLVLVLRSGPFTSHFTVTVGR